MQSLQRSYEGIAQLITVIIVLKHSFQVKGNESGELNYALPSGSGASEKSAGGV